MIRFQGQHNIAIGTTRTGKTTAVIKELERVLCPVLFFNLQEFPTRFIKADSSNDIKDIELVLASGGKIDYIPSMEIKKAKKELEVLIFEFMSCGYFTEKKPLILAIDEVHEMAREGKENSGVVSCATRGISKGVHCVFITQRPQLMDKTLLSQSTKHVIFRVEPSDLVYLKSKCGYDVERLEKMWGTDRHNYIVKYGLDYTGPFKEKL